MKMSKWFKSLWRRQPRVPVAHDPAPVHPVQATLAMLAQTQEVELSCDEVYALLDVFAERAQRGEDVATLMPLVHHHLKMCPDCREEFTALLRSLEATSA